MILYHDATDQRSNELEALHPFGVSHSWVHGIAVTLNTGLMPTVRCLDKQWELRTHQFCFNHTEGKGGRIIFLFVSWLQFILVIRTNIEAVTSVLHHGKLCVSQFTDLIELTKG